MLDWLIVGGGIHGTYYSRALVEEGGVPRDAVRVLDAEAEPLASWRRATRATGMQFMRSPSVHHLAAAPMDLHAFARSRFGRDVAVFAPPYEMPALALFERHTEHVLRSSRLAELRLHGRCRGLARADRAFRVDTDRGTLHARRVVLALGVMQQPRIPAWANRLRSAGVQAWHVADDGFVRPAPDAGRVAVVGAGISGGHLANTLAAEGAGRGPLEWITPRPLRVADLDTDPGWVGPKFLDGFHAVDAPDRRRALMRGVRNTGTIPAIVEREARRHLASGALRLQLGRVVDAVPSSGGGAVLRVASDAGDLVAEVAADVVLLATGFEQVRPGGAWLTDTIDRLGLRCAACGFPIADDALAWTEGLHVGAALAELAVGPVARNIIGARMVGARLAAVARAS